MERKLLEQISRQRLLGPLSGVVLLVMFTSPALLTEDWSLRLLVSENAGLILLAIAVTLPLMLGRLDLSAGTTCALAQTIALLAYQHFGSFGEALLCAIAVGILVGCCNALLVAVFRIEALMATLGVAAVSYSAHLALTGGRSVIADLDPALVNSIVGSYLGVPALGIYVLVIILATLAFLRLSPVGVSIRQHENFVAAGTRRQTLAMFVAFGLGGAISGAAGVFVAFKLQMSQPSTGLEFTFPAVVSAILGAMHWREKGPTITGTVVACSILSLGLAWVAQDGGEAWAPPLLYGLGLILAMLLAFVGARRAPDNFLPIDFIQHSKESIVAANIELQKSRSAAEASAERASRERKRAIELLQTLRRSRLREAAAIAAEEERTRFLANMSHELRTPLNGIIGVLELMKTAQREKVPALLDVALNSADSLLELVSDVLDETKSNVTNDTADSKMAAPRTVLKSVVSALEPIAKRKAVAIETSVASSVPDTVPLESWHLRKILVNLVGNALKYTDVGHVRVAISCSAPALPATGQRQLVIKVSDTGCGIPTEDMPHIFEQYYCGSLTQAKHQSSGLGLHLVHQIVSQSSGQITCESQAGKGTQFTIALPLESYSVELTKLDDELFETSRIGVLVIDGNPVNRMIMADYLDDARITVHQAKTIREAAKYLRTSRLDLVLVDISGPDGAAERVIKELRAVLVAQVDPLVVALGGLLPDVDGNWLSKLGYDGHVTKPMRRADVVRYVDQIIQKRQISPKLGERCNGGTNALEVTG